MNDLPIMHMLHSEAQLCEHVDDVLLTEWLSSLLFDFVTQVTSIGKIHHNAQFAFFGFESLDKFNDVWMPQMLNNSRLLESFFPLVLAHSGDVDDLHDTHKSVRQTLDQERLSE